jgi:hypothetical protein
MKRLIADLEREHPDIKHSMISALGRVVPSHLIDRDLQPAPGAPRVAHGVSPAGEADAQRPATRAARLRLG